MAAPAPAARPAAAPAAAEDDDAIDDPKVFRRLGTRINVSPAPPAPAPPPAAPPAAKNLPPPPQPQRWTPPPADKWPGEPPRPVAPLPSQPDAGEGPPTVVDSQQPAVEKPFRPVLPRLKLGLRRFDFVRIGASDTPDGIAAPMTFNNLSVDVYPVSRGVRVGLTSAFGWESGTFVARGDYFATQTLSLGVQYRDFGRVVPFAEAFAGVGYMRRVQFDRTIPTAFWQYGADAGVEIYFARVGYISLALGYLRPINGFARRQTFTSVYVDTWSFKIGIGI
jgi:hypothetical protein